VKPLAEKWMYLMFNIDDLGKVRERTLARRPGPVVECLTRHVDQKRQEVVRNLFARLNGKLTEANKEYIAGAFRCFQTQLLHGPISVLSEETHGETAGGHTLLDALRKLFRLRE
jgi:hypothetical protein